MAEIGLGNHYLEYNGRGSCKNIRIRAVKQLEAAIDKHHQADKGSIAKPEKNLIRLVQLAAENEGSDNILTGTWEIASEVIAAHILAAHLPEGSREESYKKEEEVLKIDYSKYLQPRTQHSAAY